MLVLNRPRVIVNKSRDPEMSSTEKNNQWYFGMNAHIGVKSRIKPIFKVLFQQLLKSHNSTETYSLFMAKRKLSLEIKTISKQLMSIPIHT